VGLRCQVSRNENGLPAGFAYPLCGVLGIAIFVKVSNRHISAFAGEGDRNSFANPGVTTCHQGYFSFEPAVAAIGLLAVIGSGLHLTRVARRLLVLLGIRRSWISLIDHGFFLVLTRPKQARAVTVP
jgi:hypothetical protein